MIRKKLLMILEQTDKDCFYFSYEFPLGLDYNPLYGSINFLWGGGGEIISRERYLYQSIKKILKEHPIHCELFYSGDVLKKETVGKLWRLVRQQNKRIRNS